MKRKAGESETKPWDSWPRQLSASADFKMPELFTKLNDPAVLREMHSEIRTRVVDQLQGEVKEKNTAVILAGGRDSDWDFYDSDTSVCAFRQEPFFRYLFCINHADAWGVIDVDKKETVLFVKEIHADHIRWTGAPFDEKYHLETHGIPNVIEYSDTSVITKELQRRGIKKLFTLNGVNSDSGLPTKYQVGKTITFSGVENFHIDNSEFLWKFLCEQRVIKTPKEQDYLRLATLMTSQAHVYVMRNVRAGMSEMHLEAMFKAYTNFYGGARHQAYTCICGSGPNGGVLHYGHAARPNDRILKPGDSCLLDMGSEFNGYATDVTRSYPVGGKFSADQAAIHTAVHEAQQAVYAAMKPGAKWGDLHRISERVILQHLIKIGILQHGTVEEMIVAHVGAAFLPHGMGHLIGLNCHDVGGYTEGPPRSKQPGLCWLRTGRVLKEGMVLTVEPGIYFQTDWLKTIIEDPARGKYINQEVLARFYPLGGCRLEDDVLVTATGCENMCVLPTTVEEIEQLMADGGDSKRQKTA